MAETKYILILANSKRPGGYCVAGKLATPLEDGKFDISSQWIRLVDPRNPTGGVPYGSTFCQGRAIRPLDMVKEVITGTCGNPDHPEDYFFDPNQPWQKVAEFEKSWLPDLLDKHVSLWHDGTSPNAVASGFVRTITPRPFSICLIEAPKAMDFCYWNKTVPDTTTGNSKIKPVRELSFSLAGAFHEFSVTDPEFMERHKIWNKMTGMPQIMRISNSSNYFLCLSLGLAFNGRHYKIGATIFEP